MVKGITTHKRRPPIMKRMLRIGMDVHSTNYTLCAMEPVLGEDDRIFADLQVTPAY